MNLASTYLSLQCNERLVLGIMCSKVLRHVDVNKLLPVRTFFGAYFHEDWREEADDADEVVKAYAAENRPDHLRTLSEAILYYIDGIKDDRDLDELIFEELRCYYVPLRDGVRTRDWLKRVAQLLVENDSER
jgi:hypothetical protein